MTGESEKIQVRVSVATADFLRAKARSANLPLTELGGALLEYAAQAEANEEGEALILPTVRQVVRQELQHFLERTFDFQVRTYMEAGTARRMVQAAMYYETPMPLERIKAVEEKQWSQTWQASKRHFAGLEELLALYRSGAELRSAKEEALAFPVNFDDESPGEG